jgi:hypothetical protein
VEEARSVSASKIFFFPVITGDRLTLPNYLIFQEK